jgi:hypothetical protein
MQTDPLQGPSRNLLALCAAAVMMAAGYLTPMRVALNYRKILTGDGVEPLGTITMVSPFFVAKVTSSPETSSAFVPLR